MAGIANVQRVSALDTIFSTNLYLRLLRWSGSAGTSAGACVRDDGTLPTNLVEVTGGGYAPLLVNSTNWAGAVAGAPTTKQCPKSGGTNLVFACSGGTWVEVCAYAWTSDNAAISGSNYVSGGPLTIGGVVAGVTVVSGRSLTFDPTINPILERLGDPPAGINPT